MHYSVDYLSKTARDRVNEAQAYAARQRSVPSFRRRLAYKLEALALWLEPDLKAPRPERAPMLERAF